MVFEAYLSKLKMECDGLGQVSTELEFRPMLKNELYSNEAVLDPVESIAVKGWEDLAPYLDGAALGPSTASRLSR